MTKIVLPLLAALVVACSGTTSTSHGSGAGGEEFVGNAGVGGNSTTPEWTSSSTGTTGSGAGKGSADAATSTGSGESMSKLLGCFEAPPGFASEPPPLVDATGCPDVQAGANLVDGRKFLVALPKDVQPNESLPVVFLWHWLGGSAQGFFDKADVQTAVDHYRFIAISMESKGDLKFKWPFLPATTPVIGNSEGRVNDELKFFDRTLACVNKSFHVNRQCVSSVGVSAGALWTQVLASRRSEFLSSIESLSGGEGNVVRPWKESAHTLPAMVLWGGSGDNCLGLFSFELLSKNLETVLQNDGHFVVECIHNCGHAVPPFDPLPNSPTQFGALWEFALDHPRWLPAGESPWQQKGFPSGFPSWCGMGVGKAIPRTGPCKDKPGC